MPQSNQNTKPKQNTKVLNGTSPNKEIQKLTLPVKRTHEQSATNDNKNQLTDK